MLLTALLFRGWGEDKTDTPAHIHLPASASPRSPPRAFSLTCLCSFLP